MSFQKYSINNDLIYDFECLHNKRKRPYNKYCMTCKKNICSWCKDHENHKIISFDSIEPDEEMFNKYENQLVKMQSIKDELNKRYLRIVQAKENIEKISKLINDVHEQLKNLSNEYESHLKFNSVIFNSYKNEKMNFYILSNFKKLDFTSEANYLDNLLKNTNINKAEYIANLFDDNKNNKINGKSALEEDFNQLEINKNLIKKNTQIIKEYEEKIKQLNDQNSQLKKSLQSFSSFYSEDNNKNKISEEEKNMWISEKYCKTWGLREAIREFIQNQYDGIITQLGSKKNLNVKKVGSVYNFDGRNKYLDYDFIKIDDNKIYGEIRYDKNLKNLSISNIGELFLSDFLLGGAKDEQNNIEIIGIFGEGMKLAILALCRLEKDVIIISSKKKYSFRLKEDINFIKNSVPQKCLHCKIEDYYDNDCIDKVKVIIKNITENEWANEINNYLWLLENDIEIYTSVDKNNNNLGQIIFEDYLKSKIFVKGIFVQEIKEDKKHEVPGFNTILKID